MLPVYLREAMWLSFASSPEPTALQVGVGKVCAVSGRPWGDGPAVRPQNYVVLPRQPWLDGINSGKGTVRQFVAVPMGLGATVEGQVTGEESWGGIQLRSFPLEPGALAAWREEERRRAEAARRAAAAPAPGGYGMAFAAPGAAPRAAAPASTGAMGLGVGGSMRQEVYQDTRPLSDWADTPSARVFVHLVTPPQWRAITGEEPPPSPADRAAYTRAGLPWFEYGDETAADLPAAAPLAGVEPVGQWLGDDHDPWAPPGKHQIQPLGDAPAPGSPVADGDW
jgi:hypothetical protein